MGTDPDHGLSGALGINHDGNLVEHEDEPADLFADKDLLRPAAFKGPRRPGRPKGARNKRTQELADYILGRYRDPLIGLADIVSTPIPTLATQLGMSKAKAAEFWRKCASELAPYLHQKQPTAVVTNETSAGFLAMVTEAQAAALEEGANPFAPGFAGLALTAEKSVEDQEDSDDDDGASYE